MSAALVGRTALVTGASRGIGAAVAHALAADGARVAVTARSAATLDALASELGAGHLAIPADLTDTASVDAMAARVTVWAGGAPDLLINNAGVFPRASIEAQSVADFATTLALNLTAPFAVVHAFLAAMRARGSGTIVSIGTVADRTIYPHNAAYSASKYGARAVHEVLRAETRGTGVRACLIAPGPVDTPIWDIHEAALGHTLPPRDAMLRVEDVVAAVRFVVSQPAHVNVDELRLNFR